MGVRAIRGAITIDHNTKQEIILYTKQLLREIMHVNGITSEDMISIFFTTTKDVNATFPAVAARELKLNDIPLMCAHEMEVPGSLSKCIRVMMHVNTDKTLAELSHIYLRDAKKLRPDLAK